MGGGAMYFDFTVLNPQNTSSSLSASCINLPVSANSSIIPKTPCTASYCSFHGGTCRRLSVDERKDNRAIGSLCNIDFGPVPSQFEVENEVVALQNFLQGISSYGSISKWLQPILDCRDPRSLQSEGYRRFHDAFQLLQTDPSFKRLVVSLCSDKAVWDAIVNHEFVRKLQDLPYSGGDEKPRSSNDGPDLVTCTVRWILDITRANITELIEKFLALVTDIFQFPEREKAKAEGKKEQLEEKVKSSLLLSLVILLIVVLARLQGP